VRRRNSHRREVHRERFGEERDRAVGRGYDGPFGGAARVINSRVRRRRRQALSAMKSANAVRIPGSANSAGFRPAKTTSAPAAAASTAVPQPPPTITSRFLQRHRRAPFVSHTGFSARRRPRPSGWSAPARGGGEGTLRIACAETMTAGLPAPVLRAWHRQWPSVLITLVEKIQRGRAGHRCGNR